MDVAAFTRRLTTWRKSALIGLLLGGVCGGIAWTPCTGFGPMDDPLPPAAEPDSDPPALQLPPLPENLPNLPHNPQVEQQIQHAIDRGVTDPSSADPVLEGILSTLKSKGSVVDGAFLELQTDSNVAADSVSDADYELAEQLLKTARMLAKHPALDPPRQQLIRQLRDEARRMLQTTRPSSY